jgi:hypothetical protein
MDVEGEDVVRPGRRILRVRCLDCGVLYLKPTQGGIVSTNPGCPGCGYVGWMVESPTLPRNGGRRRFVSDRLPRRRG